MYFVKLWFKTFVFDLNVFDVFLFFFKFVFIIMRFPLFEIINEKFQGFRVKLFGIPRGMSKFEEKSRGFPERGQCKKKLKTPEGS